tara:strand:+ start:913 stop:1254 length:342 start_codon:yes stop_codon:yes gene_type:complete
MPSGTYRVDVHMLFEQQNHAVTALNALTARLDAGLAEQDDRISITRDVRAGGTRVQGTMRFATAAARNALKATLVTAAGFALGYRVSTHLCKHSIGGSCGKATIVEGGDLSVD